MNIAIYKREIAYYTVQPEYNRDAIQKGYTVGNIVTTVTNAEVIGRPKLVDQVKNVVAPVQLNRNTNENINKNVYLKALDKNGNIVNVTMSPEITNIKIPVKAGIGNKTVPIIFTGDKKLLDQYNISANINQIKITGNMNAINKIKNIKIPIDLKNINGNTKEIIKIKKPNNIQKISSKTINVTIQSKET